MVALNLAKLKQTASAQTALRDSLQIQLKELQAKRSDLMIRLQAEELTQVLFQQTAKETQEQLRFHIQDLVQTALDSVFPGKYTFRVDFELKRGRTEALLYLDKDGTKMNPMDSNGGGVVDIISLALRLSAWSIARTAPIMLLDEPFKFLSAKYRPLMGEMLAGVSARLGLQIIMVTHDPDMVEIADKVFRIDQKNRKSFISEVTH